MAVVREVAGCFISLVGGGSSFFVRPLDRTMNNRTIFLASVVLAFVALVIHSVAREKFDTGSKLKAKQLEVAVKQQTHYTPAPEASRLFSTGRTLNRVGTGFTITAAICVFVAIARREPGWYSVPLLLLLFDLGVQMLL